MARHLQNLFIFVFVSCFGILTMWIDSGVGSEINSDTSENDAFAKVAVKGDRMEWHINVQFEKLTVIVLGPDESKYVQVFEGGSLPFFQMRGNDGELFPDGACSYQLQAVAASSKTSRGDNLPSGRNSNEKPGISEISQQSVTQSGVFFIEERQIISNEASVEMETNVQTEPSFETQNPDYVINDDVIITGSECIGFDCANGESFGYATQKYKENNLQIWFEDTSVGSYATNDWKILINDTTSGGASYFSIFDTDAGRRPFTIEAGAPANSLYVEDYGRIGLGTSIPYVELHIVDGDSPTIRLDQDGSSGWTAQKWDMCGNETNFFIRDVTNGSKLCFRIQPNTPNNTLTLRSTGTGRVGVGTWSPAAKLHVFGDKDETAPLLQVSGHADATGAPLFLVQREVADASKQTFFTVKDSGDVEILKTIGEGSDRNQKKNIEPIDTAIILAGVVNMPVSRWNYKVDDDEVRHLGPMAQDFHAAFGLGQDDKHIASIDASGVSLAAIQELNKQLELQKERILKQNEIIQTLKEQVAQLGKKRTQP